MLSARKHVEHENAVSLNVIIYFFRERINGHEVTIEVREVKLSIATHFISFWDVQSSENDPVTGVARAQRSGKLENRVESRMALQLDG